MATNRFSKFMIHNIYLQPMGVYKSVATSLILNRIVFFSIVDAAYATQPKTKKILQIKCTITTGTGTMSMHLAAIKRFSGRLFFSANMLAQTTTTIRFFGSVLDRFYVYRFSMLKYSQVREMTLSNFRELIDVLQ